MKQKPSRTFVYLALIMVFLLVIGLVLVGALVSDVPVTGDHWTATAALATNSAMVENAIQTKTFVYVRDIATNLKGFELPPAFFQTHEAENQTEILQVNASLGATEAAKYWATETAVLTNLSETMIQMSIEDTLTRDSCTLTRELLNLDLRLTVKSIYSGGFDAHEP